MWVVMVSSYRLFEDVHITKYKWPLKIKMFTKYKIISFPGKENITVTLKLKLSKRKARYTQVKLLLKS